MQTIVLFAKCLLMLILSSVALETRAATEKADARGTVAKSHASVRAYPSAVISLKDPKSEIIFYVESNGRRLVALDKNGTVEWNVDVVESAKSSTGVGPQVIRDLKLGKGRVHVTFAKHSFADVQIDSGKATYLGSD